MENARDEEVPAPAPEHQVPTLVPELPVDMLSLLLSRLPVLDLVRYRSVSPVFNSSILDPNCVRSHLRRSPRNHNLAAATNGEGLMITCYERQNIPPPNMNERPALRFRVDHTLLPLTSCNGVLCLIEIIGGRRYQKTRRIWVPDRLYRKRKMFQHVGLPTKLPKARLIQNAPRLIGEDQGYRLTFLNPATKIISQPSQLLQGDNVGRHSRSFGFGYNVVRHVHKVVVVPLINKGRVYAYTMETRQWSNIGVFPGVLIHSSDPTVEFLKDNVYLDGTLNWIATNFNRNQLFIISLNLETEVFNQKKLPQQIQIQDIKNLSKIHIGVLSEKLSFSYYSDTNSFVVWRLQEFAREESWVLLANITLELLPMPVNEHQSPLMRFLPLNMLEDLNVLTLLVRTNRLHLIFYHCGENVFAGLQEFEFGEENAELRWLDDADYMESLVRPI